ncbi:hypothetical protein DENSPDRAFT_784809 [Dentipellis sp. KUC8613]|nr:hypothetical protein DENSPDRAFT_784809 [Dentipellis sp. KUC8613]
MLGTLNLFLAENLSYTWRSASLVVAQASGRSEATARSIRSWLHAFLHKKRLLLHLYGRVSTSILHDEDFQSKIQLHLLECAKKGPITAQDVVDYVASPEIQEQLGGRKKKSISLATAKRWLQSMAWRYGKKKNGMYIDGHEREDVVKYRTEFIARWKEYEKRMVLYDNNGKIVSTPKGFPVPQGGRFRLYVITHDESTFYQNDQHKNVWSHPDLGPTPQPKGEGESLMISDFLVPEWGRLKHDDMEARMVFRAGKNRDGYFMNDDMLKAVDNAIDIFEARTDGRATGLFIFDNATIHTKRADDALSASRMPKRPNKGWTHRPGGPKMRDARFSDGSPQPLYFPDDHPTMPGWFKGTEQILRERGLYPASGLSASCKKCPQDRKDCCCRRVLYFQPDFAGQKSALEELCEARGHLCDFYPKFHPELNFIEQYWGAGKLRYRVAPRTSDTEEMERIVKESLDDISQQQILR